MPRLQDLRDRLRSRIPRPLITENYPDRVRPDNMSTPIYIPSCIWKGAQTDRVFHLTSQIPRRNNELLTVCKKHNHPRVLRTT